MPDRSDYIVDDDSDEENDCEQCDMVNICLNLAYVKREVAKDFKFKPGYSKQLGKEIKHFQEFASSTINLPKEID